MASVSTYLNFQNQTEAAFEFYKGVFNSEYSAFQRMKDVPSDDGAPPLPEDEQNRVMHVCLPILDGHLLMGSDAPKSMGFNIHQGNHSYINLQPDTLEEAQQLFDALSHQGQIEQPFTKMFWNAYFGSLEDQFGVRWMVNFALD